jgi:hypothetical protein
LKGNLIVNKVFKIETRRGFVALPERIGNYSFPLNVAASCQGATPFQTRAFAERVIKRHKLGGQPCFAHVEEFEE